MARIRFWGILSITLLLQISLASGQAEEDLVAYWPFDAAAGVGVQDVSGNGHDGEIVDDVERVPGKFERALDFGAGGGYVIVPDHDDLDLSTDVTYMGWFNLNEPIVGQRRMMSKNNSIFFLFDFGNADSLDFLVKPANDFTETTTSFEVGQWYHFAGTYDGDALRIYIDGVMEGETGGVGDIATSELDLWIGADDHNLPTTTFPGLLDDIRIYSKALSDAEIRKAMEGPLAVEKTQDKLAVLWSSMKQVD